MRLIVAITGASGAIYGIRLLEALREARNLETHLVLSNGGKLNIAIETDWSVGQVEALADEVHSDQNLAATIASGSFRTAGMIVAPCSMKTLSGVVNSYADNLVVRAADVALKEGRRLVLMPRETPLHAGHCRLLLQAAEMGAIIAPNSSTPCRASPKTASNGAAISSTATPAPMPSSSCSPAPRCLNPASAGKSSR